MTKNPPKFSTHQKDFVEELNKSVNEYFAKNKISKHANGKMIFKTIFHLSIWFAAYFYLMIGQPSLGVAYALWGVLGVMMAMVAVNIGHDAIHGAYSSKPWVNHIMSHTFNINGASAYMWKRMHNIAHHTYTNVDGLDEDIESVPIIRMSPQMELKPIHKYQQYYSMMVYGLATITWVFMKDYIKFFKNEVGNFRGEKHSTSAMLWLFFYKIINYTLFIVVPFVVLPYAWYHILFGFLIMHYTSGLLLAIIFMLAHIVEEAHFPMPDKENNLQHSWFVHQLYTTVNFSKDNPFALFVTGGLNMQVEHHLFPNICHIHYPEISQIVERTALKYDYPYFSLTFPQAVSSHFRFLKNMGRIQDYVPKYERSKYKMKPKPEMAAA